MQSQTTTLVDRHNRPLRDLRISVTDRCNFRCGYCMPKDVFGRDHKFLKQDQLLSFDEIQRLVKIFASFGVTKLRLTGGEPLLRKNIEQLIENLANVEGIDDIAMTTNASLLNKTRAKQLKGAGLNRLNISLDALDKKVFQQMIDVKVSLDDILKGIDCAIDAGFDSIKVNMVVQKNINHQDILPMAKHFRNSDVILRFIEFMDVGNHNHWSQDQVFSAQQIVDLIHSEYPLENLEPNYQGEVAKRWNYQDGAGEIGVISSISQPFCGSCARARLSAIGELFTCLFATSGFDLRSLLRAEQDDQIITEKVANIWRARTDRYSEERFAQGKHPAPRNSQKVEMSYIGG